MKAELFHQGQAGQSGQFMDWNIYLGPNGIWVWAIALPNGWTAGVADIMASAEYCAYAYSPQRIVTITDKIATLKDAKSIALWIALAQTQCTDPMKPDLRSKPHKVNS